MDLKLCRTEADGGTGCDRFLEKMQYLMTNTRKLQLVSAKQQITKIVNKPACGEW